MTKLTKGMLIQVTNHPIDQLNDYYFVSKGGASPVLVFWSAAKKTLLQRRGLSENPMRQYTIRLLDAVKHRDEIPSELLAFQSREAAKSAYIKGQVYEVTETIKVGGVYTLGKGGRILCVKGGSKPTFKASKDDGHHDLRSSISVTLVGHHNSMKEVPAYVDKGLERISTKVKVSPSSHPDSDFIVLSVYLDGGTKPVLIYTDDGWGGGPIMDFPQGEEKGKELHQLLLAYASKVALDHPHNKDLEETILNQWDHEFGLIGHYAYHACDEHDKLHSFAKSLLAD